MPVIRAALFIGLILCSFAFGAPVTWLCRRLGISTDCLARDVCRMALTLLGIRVRVEGPSTPKPRLVVANHVSWIDILVLASVEPVCFLAKRDVATWPLLGHFARAQHAVFVDRRRTRQILCANRQMADRMRDARSVVLFPEGTTHDGTRRGRFLTSHLACLRDRFDHEPGLAQGVAQPVAIAYSDPVAAWVGDATLLPHLWAMLRRSGVTCRLAYGEAIVVERGFDRKRLGPRLAWAVEDLLRTEYAASAQPSHANPVLAPRSPIRAEPPSAGPHRADGQAFAGGRPTSSA